MYKCSICRNNTYREKKLFADRIGIDRNLFSIVQCRKCGLISLQPVPTNEDLTWIYSNYAEKGDRVFVEKQRIQNVYPLKIKKFESYLSRSAHIFDIGAGMGGFCRVAKDAGFKVTGIEYEEEQVNLAKNLFNINLEYGSITTFIENNQIQFDAVHMNHVLEHLQNPLQTLMGVKKVLKENGIIIVEVPNELFKISKKNLQIFLRMKEKKASSNPYHHIYFFSPKTIRQLFEQAGYEIVELNQPTRKGLDKSIINFINSVLGLGVSNKIEIVAKLKK